MKPSLIHCVESYLAESDPRYQENGAWLIYVNTVHVHIHYTLSELLINFCVLRVSIQYTESSVVTI